jgi:GrpB-like predicted nucleotidyltransferase (UPF0157 family)
MNKYEFRPYSTQFPLLFEREKQRLAVFMPSDAIIEHIGSTAVPGLGGKGIIDISIAVQQNYLQQASAALQRAGYEFRPLAGTSERLFHRIDLPDPVEGVRRYHVHLTHPEHPDWTQTRAFRDYLRSHPEAVEAYAQAKQIAVNQSGGDGQRYMDTKQPVIEQILQAALQGSSRE